MAFGVILLAGYSGQSRAGKMAPSCPLGQPITACDLGHLASSRSQPYNKNGYCIALHKFVDLMHDLVDLTLAHENKLSQCREILILCLALVSFWCLNNINHVISLTLLLLCSFSLLFFSLVISWVKSGKTSKFYNYDAIFLLCYKKSSELSHTMELVVAPPEQDASVQFMSGNHIKFYCR